MDWRPGSDVATLNLKQAGITGIIYGTGFEFDFNWVDSPVLDARGYPR